MAEDPHVSFTNPPVAEVVAGVAFQRLPGATAVHLGRLWDRHLATTFPQVEQKPPYGVPVERFGSDARIPNLAAELVNDFPTPRFWFRSNSEDQVLQIQNDWFACNWRKVEPGQAYDRWPARREAFEHWFQTFATFMENEALGTLRPIQCEVTYINHVLPNNEWKGHGDLHKILKLSADVDTPLPQEQAAVQYEFLMNEEGRPIGRLHVSARPALMANEQPVFVLELTARGRPSSPDLDAVLALLDRGRRDIVKTFAAITTDEIQREWGRTNGD